jgi:hypothetical protein
LNVIHRWNIEVIEDIECFDQQLQLGSLAQIAKLG